METLIRNWLVPNWEKKIVAFFAAILIWMYVSQSVQGTRTISGIPVKVTHLAPGKTIEGIQPSGTISQRMSLTLTGPEKFLDHLRSNDLLIELDASHAADDWQVHVTHDNVISNNPDISLQGNISKISHPDFEIHLSKLITAKIPVNVLPPIGDPPEGYELLDIWPSQLEHTVSGPEKEVQSLKGQGLDLTFDLSHITKKQLDALKPTTEKDHLYSDEVSFIVPANWKKVTIPFKGDAEEVVNDPEANFLQITFLKKQYIPVNQLIPVEIFYPLHSLESLNPTTMPLLPSPLLTFKQQIPCISIPLYTYRVSRLFLETVRDYLEISVVASLIPVKGAQAWSVNYIDPQGLEDNYVHHLRNRMIQNEGLTYEHMQRMEQVWRERFRHYMYNLTFYQSPGQIFELTGRFYGTQGIILEQK